jgi:uncharacterized repeat protein (TIGR01451 family)
MSLSGRRKRAPISLAILGVLSLLVTMISAGPASAGPQKQYEFNFVNGTTLSGVTSDKVHFLAGAGGTDADNPIGMNVHLSCSDKFEGGFGQKDGPDPVLDSAWQIESYSIGELKNGQLTLKCGDSFAPPGPPPTPAIQLVKTVNGEDANSPTGPRVNVGDTVTLGYVVTNTGNVALSNVTVTDLDLGPVGCPRSVLDPDESMTCNEAQVEVTQVGPVFMEARTDGTASINSLPEAPVVSKGHAFAFLFTNGQTITGTSATNVAFVPDAGGTDANNPTGMDVHVSCSDQFVGGFGQKDGPDAVLDSAWQIAAYSISKDGNAKCSNVLSPVNISVSDTDPVHFVADPAATPGIDLMKTVNGQDANTAPGVTVTVGDTITLGYKVTNTGNTTLSNVVVTDLPGGAVVPCAAAANLAVGQMVNCPSVTMEITEPGQVFMNARVDGDSPAGTNVNDEDPINYDAKEDTAPTLDPPATCSAELVGSDVKVTWTAGNGATEYAVKRTGKWLSRTKALMYTDTNVPAGTYEYFVRSINGANRTDYVSCGKVTVPGTSDGPGSCTVFYSNGNAVVDWTALDGAHSYQVRHNGYWQVRTTELWWHDTTPGHGTYTVEAVFAAELKSNRTTCDVVGGT